MIAGAARDQASEGRTTLSLLIDEIIALLALGDTRHPSESPDPLERMSDRAATSRVRVIGHPRSVELRLSPVPDDR